MKTKNNVIKGLFLFGLACAFMLAGCGGTSPDPKSDEATISSLTLAIGGTEYDAAISGTSITVTIVGDIPTSATVASVALSAGASGLTQNQQLPMTNGEASILITAEDTTTTQTYALTVIRSVVASEIAKAAQTDTRDSYVLFSINATEAKTDYHLAVKETAEAAPSDQEMAAEALKRNIGTTAINVLIAQRMSAKMIDVAKGYFDDGTETMGTGMSTEFSATPKWASAFDGADSGGTWTEATQTWVADSVLKPNTAYTLYGMENGGSSVHSILDFQTDQSPTSYVDINAADELTGLDSTLNNGSIEITINPDEYYIFPVQTKGNVATAIGYLNFTYSNQTGGPTGITASTRKLFSASDPGHGYQMILFPFKSTFGEEAHNFYVLMDTSRISNPSNTETVEFGKYFNYSVGGNSLEFKHSSLKFQQ